MKTMLVLIGLPASGKSTFALDLVRTKENWVRVNRDDLRTSLFGVEVNPHIEDLITKVQDSIIKEALKSGKSVVVDNVNVRQKYRNDLFKIAANIGDVLYEEKMFRTPLQDCIERNSKRDRKVPVSVIEKFAKEGKEVLWGKYKPRIEFIPPKTGSAALTQDQNLPKAIMCDLDGTLSLLNGRNPYDASTCDKDLPNYPVLETLKLYYDAEYQIIFCSGREDKYKEQTERFLETHFVTYFIDLSKEPFKRDYKLFMRKTGDLRKDSIIKEEIFNESIRDKYNVLFVMDDRNQVVEGWRDIGLTCFQVAPGDF